MLTRDLAGACSVLLTTRTAASCKPRTNQVSYAEDGVAWPWKGGFEVIALLPAGIDEPAYRIRNATRLMTVSCASTS